MIGFGPRTLNLTKFPSHILMFLLLHEAKAEISSLSCFFKNQKKKGCSRVMTQPAGRVRRFLKCRRSGRVESAGVRNLTGRVGSGRIR